MRFLKHKSLPVAFASLALLLAGPHAFAQEMPAAAPDEDPAAAAPDEADAAPIPVMVLPPPPPAPDEAEQQAELKGPGLWVVRDDDTTIYLFGTVHLLPEGVDWYNGSIAEALNTSDEIVTEIEMGPDTQTKIQQLVMEKGLLPSGTTLRSLLSDEDKADYEAAMTKLGVPATAFDQFEPWMAGINLITLPLMKHGYSPQNGVEEFLLKEAGDKQRGALETMEFQLGIFDSLPQEMQIAFMMKAARGIDDVKPLLDSMVEVWLAGDAEALAKLMNEDFEDSPELAEKMLYDRNRNWAEWIDQRMDTPGRLFIAVGAGHLAGENSVQDMLEEAGTTVTRIQ